MSFDNDVSSEPMLTYIGNFEEFLKNIDEQMGNPWNDDPGANKDFSSPNIPVGNCTDIPPCKLEDFFDGEIIGMDVGPDINPFFLGDILGQGMLPSPSSSRNFLLQPGSGHPRVGNPSPPERLPPRPPARTCRAQRPAYPYLNGHSSSNEQQMKENLTQNSDADAGTENNGNAPASG